MDESLNNFNRFPVRVILYNLLLFLIKLSYFTQESYIYFNYHENSWKNENQNMYVSVFFILQSFHFTLNYKVIFLNVSGYKRIPINTIPIVFFEILNFNYMSFNFYLIFWIIYYSTIKFVTKEKYFLQDIKNSMFNE